MTWSLPAYEAVARLVGVRTGLAFASNRCDSAEQGIRRAMTRAGVSDPARYLERLAADADALDDLIIELTVGETYFFREPDQFRFIRTEVVPEIRQRRGAEHVIRTWSAGCASGEEAYSLAILFTREGLARQTHILGTDISRAALKRARQAVYTSWSLRGQGVAEVQPFLTREGNLYRLDDSIRRLVAFEYLNLALGVYPSFASGTWGADLILCRNVLIYFDADTVQSVARRLFESLADGGWLIMASSDPPLADKAPFESVVTADGVFYRRRAAVTLPSPPQPPSPTEGGGGSQSAFLPSPLDGGLLLPSPPGGGGAGGEESLPPLAPVLRGEGLGVRGAFLPSPPGGGGAGGEESLPPLAPVLRGEGLGVRGAFLPSPPGGGGAGGEESLPPLAPVLRGEGLGVRGAFLPSPPGGGGAGGGGFDSEPPAIADASGAARQLFARGDYAGAARLTRDLQGDAGAAALHVRALANLNPAQAEPVCAEASARHPTCAELHYLHAVLLLDLGRDADAAQAARRVIYLDRTLAIAHFTLGSILRRQDDRAGARRAYRNARDLCSACPGDQVVPLADGEHAARLAEAAETELALLDTPPR